MHRKLRGLAEELFNHFRSDITKLNLVPSSGGAFEVTVNDIKVYSKLETGEFPQVDEIIEKIK
nr:Rdx family protein [Anaerobacillus alkalidiazotrophicus]